MESTNNNVNPTASTIKVFDITRQMLDHGKPSVNHTVAWFWFLYCYFCFLRFLSPVPSNQSLMKLLRLSSRIILSKKPFLTSPILRVEATPFFPLMCFPSSMFRSSLPLQIIKRMYLNVYFLWDPWRQGLYLSSLHSQYLIQFPSDTR